MMSFERCDPPSVGDSLREKQHGDGAGQVYRVCEVFPGTGQYPGMILEWEQDGRRRAQVFTCRDWRTRWEVASND